MGLWWRIMVSFMVSSEMSGTCDDHESVDDVTEEDVTGDPWESKAQGNETKERGQARGSTKKPDR